MTDFIPDDRASNRAVHRTNAGHRTNNGQKAGIEDDAPLILSVPGLGNSGRNHWQSHWEDERDDMVRVDLGSWDKPHRNLWVNQLNLAIRNAGRPVILVAHSLGCHAVAWWAQMENPLYGNPVVAALLVAPAEVDSHPADARVAVFQPSPIRLLPFPSILVASRDDPYMQFERARRLGTFWGSRVVDAGHLGHINADSGLEDWAFGKRLLARLQAEVRGDAIDKGEPLGGLRWDSGDIRTETQLTAGDYFSMPDAPRRKAAAHPGSHQASASDGPTSLPGALITTHL